ncbi:MAG: hypothetical protein IIX67_00430 [Clostridia bacterium]|nr:hypothetical protein [Clostridia bacterium]
MKKRIFSLFLATAFVLLCLLASGCEEDTEATSSVGADASGESAEESIGGRFFGLDIPEDIDFGGKTVRVLTTSTAESPATHQIQPNNNELLTAETTTAVFTACAECTRLVEEELGITVEEEVVYTWSRYGGDMYKRIQKDAMSYTGDYVFAMPCSIEASMLSIDGVLYDLNDVPHIDLSREWWCHEFNEGVTVDGSTFFAISDIGIVSKEATLFVAFNKKMVEDYDLDDPYALVREGTWTIDKMYEMARSVTKDLDGDGKMGKADQFGFLTEIYNVYALWVGGDNMIINKDENGLPVSAMYNERSATTYDKVVEFTFDESVSAIAGRAVFPAYSDMNVCFTEGRGLFDYGAMALVSDFRESETDFGILPSPKLDAAQERYCNTFSPYNLMAYAIPATASDVSRVGTILEAMAQVSEHILTPAYMDVSLVGKFIRDNESEEMIELLLATRSYDLGAIYQWGNSFSIFNNATKSRAGTFASQVEKNAKSLNSAIQKYIDELNAAE